MSVSTCIWTILLAIQHLATIDPNSLDSSENRSQTFDELESLEQSVVTDTPVDEDPEATTSKFESDAPQDSTGVTPIIDSQQEPSWTNRFFSPEKAECPEADSESPKIAEKGKEAEFIHGRKRREQDATPVSHQEGLNFRPLSPQRRFSQEPLTTSLELHSSNASPVKNTDGALMERFDEVAYLASHEQRRGTRLWNFEYLDEAAIYRDAPILYDICWFWVRWAKKLWHFFLPRSSVTHVPASMDTLLRSSKILPLPILREASKFIEFITPDGQVANHKNLAPSIAYDVCSLPQIKVTVHLYSNHTEADIPHDKNSFYKKYLNTEIPVAPSNPFKNVLWGKGHYKDYPQEKWIRLLLKAARQLYVMLLIDSAVYSEYQSEVYRFFWESVDESVEIPPLHPCKCSMFYVSPFEARKENISFILDDSIPISFTDTEDYLPRQSGPQRNAQVSALSKDYYLVTSELIDVMSRIHSNIDASFFTYNIHQRHSATPHLYSSLGRIIPSVRETVLDKLDADATDYNARKDEFLRENSVFLDPTFMPPARFGNSYPMIHFSYDEERPSVEQSDDGEAFNTIRRREFSPLSYCGVKYFRNQVTAEDESYSYEDTVRALSALKLSAPLGPAHSSIELDIVCPCVNTPHRASPVRSRETDPAPRQASLEDEIRHVAQTGQIENSEYAIFGNNCYAVWDQRLNQGNHAGTRSDSYWALSLKDRSIVLPEIEKQLKLTGWTNATQSSSEPQNSSSQRDYKFLLELFHSQSAQQVTRSEERTDSFHAKTSPTVDKGIDRFSLASPFTPSRRSHSYVNATSSNTRVLRLGQVLPCIGACSTKFHQSADMRFYSESCMCKVGVFTEISKRWKLRQDDETLNEVLATRFSPVKSHEKAFSKKIDQASADIHESRQDSVFEDPIDAISLLDAHSMKPLELPKTLEDSLADEINNFFGLLTNATVATDATRKRRSEAELFRWFRRVLDVNHKDLPEFVKKILPHAEIMPDPLSPFKKNVICIPPSLNFHWNLQRGEKVVDNDTVYAKSVAQFYRHMHAHGWPMNEKPLHASNRKDIQQHFINEARHNHFLFSHHNFDRVFKKGPADHSGQDFDRELPIMPKDPFAQSVLPFPETISSNHDLSDMFHPFSFPRSTKKMAYGMFLSEDANSIKDATLMERIVSPMMTLSFMKHISTVSLGMYFYNILHPDEPCTSFMYSDARRPVGYQDESSSEIMVPSFLESLPTKNDVFVSIDGEAPATMKVPPHNRESVRLEEKIQKEYADLFAQHIEFLFSAWNSILQDSANGEKVAAKAFNPPLFLDFPNQSWILGADSSSSKVMPLLQEVVNPSKKMTLVNVYCPCEPLRDSAWTLMSESCVRVYRSEQSMHLYAQNPVTKEYFVIDTVDGHSVDSVKKPVRERYFGYMPQSFSSNNKFLKKASNSTLAPSSFEHFKSSDRAVIPLATDQVKMHSPCPCASVCEPLRFDRNIYELDNQNALFRRLVTHNFCQAGVTV